MSLKGVDQSYTKVRKAGDLKAAFFIQSSGENPNFGRDTPVCDSGGM